jgi:biotin synthase
LQVKSVPVNFYMHIPGSRLGEVGQLTPEYCLRVLCLFRFAIPKAEIRAAGGREINLRSLQPLALFAANSLFCEGYLNTSGQALENTKAMIRDAGFVVGAVEE